MRKLAAAVLLVVALTFGLADTVTAATLPRVTGAGTANLADLGYEGASYKFNFNARQVDSGNEKATGKIRLTARLEEGNTLLVGDILYLSVDGDNAWIGFVTTINGQKMDYVIQVQDSLTDKISIPLLVPDASYATYQPDLSQPGEGPISLLSVTHGTIRIR